MKSHIERNIFKHNLMRLVASFWETMGDANFPKCVKLALRLSILSVQSADVERMCEAHTIIHTKTRNRLQHVRVKKLLYCYINLRLLRTVIQIQITSYYQWTMYTTKKKLMQIMNRESSGCCASIWS